MPRIERAPDVPPATRRATHASSDIVRLMLDRRLWRGPAPVCLAFLVAVNLWIVHVERQLQAERRANLLTGAIAGRATGRPRFDWSVGEDLGRYWGDIPDATEHPLVIVSGMSQMYAINDPHPGDEVISEHLDDALARQGARAFGLAAPNMDNEEALLDLVAVSLEARTKPATFLYGVCFDKFRNTGLRPGLARFLQERPGLRDAWERVCASRADRYPMACSAMRASVDGATEPGAEREDLDAEHRLRAAIGRVVPMVGASADLNGIAQYDIYLFRNWLFRIRSSSKRPMLASAFRTNREFLGLMADVAKENGVTLALYVIPLNPMAQNPYIPEEYASFKTWLQTFASERGLPFANLEDVVPHDDWGLSNGEPDFKHFRERGHERTAAALLDRFGPVLGRPDRVAADVPSAR